MADMTNASVARVDPDSLDSSDDKKKKSQNGDKSSSDKSGDKDKQDKKDTGDDKKDDKAEKADDKADDPDKDKTDDINEDKDEDGDEKHKDGKGKKASMAASAASSAASAAAPVAMGAAAVAGIQALLSSLFAALQAALAAIWSAICSICSFIANAAIAVVTAVASALAISAVAAATGLVGLLVCGAIFLGGAIASAVTSDEAAKSDQAVVEEEPCEVSDYDGAVAENGGAIDATKEQMAFKVYSVYYTYFTENLKVDETQAKAMVAGILGNWMCESGVDPTAIECIYSEHYQIGPEKQAALADLTDYTLNTVFPTHYSNGISLIESAYRGNDGEYYCGLGFAQFTGPAGEAVMNIAKASGRNWYDFEVQMAYTLAPDGYSRQGYNGCEWFEMWASVLKDDSATASECALYFLDNWEGVSETPNRNERAELAQTTWLTQIEIWKKSGGPDKTLGNSIIDLAGATSVNATANARSEEVEKCKGSSIKDAVFNGVVASSFVAPAGTVGDNQVQYQYDIDGETCGKYGYTTDYSNHMGRILDEILDAEGNVKSEYLPYNSISRGLNGSASGIVLNKEGLVVPTNDYWRGECVTWSCSRIKSYIHAKYGIRMNIGKFGHGQEPAVKDELLGYACQVTEPKPNCVFSWIEGAYGHTGYVEYVDKNGVIVTSECNLGSNDQWYVCVYDNKGIRGTSWNYPDRQFEFFDLDLWYKNAKPQNGETFSHDARW